MNNRILFFVGTSMVISGALLGSDRVYRQIHSHATYAIQENVDGIAFGFKEEVNNGAVKRVWTIDGTPVGADEYEQELGMAEMNVRRRERASQEQARVRNQQRRDGVLKEGYRKIILLLIDQSNEWLKKFDQIDASLPCLLAAFKEVEQLERLIDRAGQLLKGLEDQFDLNEVQEVMKDLELVPDQLKILFYQTINEAMQRCDDTKTLKRLLDLVVQ